MSEEIKEELRQLKPVQISFGERLKEDKVFLLSMIDDPCRTLRVYGYDSDDKMLSMLNSIAKNVRVRATLLFTEIMGAASDAKGCQACDGCNVCKVCGTIGMGGDVMRGR